MRVNNVREMFMHELGDMLDAEKRVASGLEKMIKKVNNDALRQQCENHLEETEGHAERLQQIMQDLDEKPKRQPCRGMAGLLEEFQSFVKESKPGGDLLDVYATGAAIKIEHYEISSYESLLAMAQQLGLQEAASELERNLIEERNMLAKLQEIGQELISELRADEKAEEEEELEMEPAGKRQRSR